jgi:hypothetical protein
MPDTPDKTGPDREGDAHLLPGWSSLVILLSLFGVISVVSLMAILRADDVHVTPDRGGVRAFGPADFPEIDFDAPLLPAVLQAVEDDEVAGINVPPPPFTDETIFPCSSCHADQEVDPEPRELFFHEEIALDHGSEERWCLDCHNPDDRDHLRLANGSLVGFEESYRLCGQCHGTIYRDWREGIHGQRRGFWNGSKSYLLCAHCHDPHAPAFKPLEPLPPPVRPQFLAEEEPRHSGTVTEQP